MFFKAGRQKVISTTFYIILFWNSFGLDRMQINWRRVCFYVYFTVMRITFNFISFSKLIRNILNLKNAIFKL